MAEKGANLKILLWKVPLYTIGFFPSNFVAVISFFTSFSGSIPSEFLY
jgi:hypothetical protein